MIYSSTLPRVRFIALPLYLLVLSGCASVAPAIDTDSMPASSLAQPRAGQHAALQAIGNAAVGERVTLVRPNSLNASRVYVVHEYMSGNGQTCRRVQLLDAAGQHRLVCQSGQRGWHPVRDLHLPGISSQPDNAALPALFRPDARSSLAQSDVVTKTDLSEKQEIWVRTLRPDETLWSFARRVTGDANNWQEIARINELDQIDQLAPNLALTVPSHLIRP